MDSAALVLTAWLGFGACGFTAGAVSVSRVRRRLRRVSPAAPAARIEQDAQDAQDELIHAA